MTAATSRLKLDTRFPPSKTRLAGLARQALFHTQTTMIEAVEMMEDHLICHSETLELRISFCEEIKFSTYEIEVSLTAKSDSMTNDDHLRALIAVLRSMARSLRAKSLTFPSSDAWIPAREFVKAAAPRTRLSWNITPSNTAPRNTAIPARTSDALSAQNVTELKRPMRTWAMT